MWQNRKLLSLLMTLSFIVLLPACSSVNNNKRLKILEAAPPEELFELAQQDMDEGKFDAALVKYSIINKKDLFSPWAEASLLAEAELSYHLGQFDEAEDAGKRYLQLYPSSNRLEYIYYLIANSVFAKISDIDRDQSISHEAIDWFRRVIKINPNSSYAKDAKEKIEIARNQIAGQEMEVGRYYQQQHSYVAAINRFETVINDFGDTKQVPEALARLVESYIAIGISSSAQKYALVLEKNYPNSEWYGYVNSLLTQ
ncbi:outer membrane protein assembly factor BamD [Bartonella sp. DGB1]|uniref:outer membrane protein assembly factor BamD n=1 Tax=Bartonella sp. DGB1 TaxID=3239807 RepID=UPI00352565DE